MRDQVQESDWKQFRALHPVALERFSQQIIAEVRAIAGNLSLSAHDRYGEIYNLIHKRTKEMAHMFDGPSRSSMFTKLLGMRAANLITDKEWAGFSQKMQESIERFLKG